MDRKDQGRKEPSLADLEAFEKLLRESLQVEQPAPAAAAGQESTAQPTAMLDPARPASSTEASGQGGLSRDQAAMAELARLIDQPIDFAMPPQLASAPARQEPPFRQEASSRQDPMLEPPSFGALREDPAEARQPESYQADPYHAGSHHTGSHHTGPHHLEAQVEASLPADWGQAPRVTAQPAAGLAPSAAMTYEPPAPVDPEPRYEASAGYAKPAEPADPLAAFEQELRRFDAIRAGERKAAAPDYAPVATASHAYAAPDGYATPNPAAPAYADDSRYAEPTAEQWAHPAAASQPQSEAEASLQAAEDRLAAQAAAAAATAETAAGAAQSRDFPGARRTCLGRHCRSWRLVVVRFRRQQSEDQWRHGTGHRCPARAGQGTPGQSGWHGNSQPEQAGSFAAQRDGYAACAGGQQYRAAA